MKRLTATNSLLVLCVLVFALTTYLGLFNRGDLLALYYLENPQYQLFQFLSHLFMHGGLLHLFVNMFGLFLFGNAVEQRWGSARFLGFYFICGLGAALIYQGINVYEFQAAIQPALNLGLTENEIIGAFSGNQYFTNIAKSEEAFLIFAAPVVGASGALYGILLAYTFLFPNNKLALIFLPVPIAAKYFMPVLLGIELLSGITGFSVFGSNIAHWAHIGGAITGFIVIIIILFTNKIMSH